MKHLRNLGILAAIAMVSLNAEASYGQEKMKQYIDVQNAEYNKSIQLEISMRKFKEDVKLTLSLTDADIEKMISNGATIYLTKLDLYLIPSHKIINNWDSLFHITKNNVDIHNIRSSDSFDIHKSQGTASYSFAGNKILRHAIIKQLDRGNFIVLHKNKYLI